MILLDTCPLCLNKNLAKKLHCIDHTASKEKFIIVSCETCDFTFTNPRPKDDLLANYYKSEMYISHTNSNEGFFSWMYQAVRRYAIKTKVSLLKNVITCDLRCCLDLSNDVLGLRAREVILIPR